MDSVKLMGKVRKSIVFLEMKELNKHKNINKPLSCLQVVIGEDRPVEP